MNIADYKPLMYLEESSSLLRTGDIIHLQLADFKEIVKYESILPVLEQFENDPNYSGKLWALMNQPCDLVHSKEQGRYLKTNLFLCPLQGLKTGLKKGLIGDLVHFESVKSPENVFVEIYKKYLTKKAETESAKGANESKGDYYRRLNQDVVDPAMSKIQQDLETVKGEFGTPGEIVTAFKEHYASEQNLVQSLEEFEVTENWVKAVEQYRKSLDEAEKKNNSLILKADADKKLANLCLNQMDSQGLFFYEPHAAIFKPEIDLSYIILLQDMLTIKIKRDAQESGAVFEKLTSKRVLSLKENFSDRLLNIMGNYFSKIGTSDVRSDKVIELYRCAYADSFFTSNEQFAAHHKKQQSEGAPAASI